MYGFHRYINLKVQKQRQLPILPINWIKFRQFVEQKKHNRLIVNPYLHATSPEYFPGRPHSTMMALHTQDYFLSTLNQLLKQLKHIANSREIQKQKQLR